MENSLLLNLVEYSKIKFQVAFFILYVIHFSYCKKITKL